MPIFYSRCLNTFRSLIYLFLVLFIFLSYSITTHAAPIDSAIKAVKFDDVKAIKKWLEEGNDPNTTDLQGTPFLVLAAREKSNKVAELLINTSHINLEKRNTTDENALMLAAINGDYSLVKSLLQHGAQVNKTGWSPLHYAASSKNIKLLQLLIDKRAQVNALSPNGSTPLMMAARTGDEATVQLLLNNGADISIKNQLGFDAAGIAKKYGEESMEKALKALQ